MASGIVFAFAGFLLAATMPADASYYPLAEGARWSYLAGDGEEIEETVRTIVDVQGGQAGAVATASGAESYYVYTPEGLVRFYSRPAGGLGAERGTWVLRFPVRLGDTWESWTPVGTVEFHVGDRGPVKTQAGSFPDAIRVDFTAVPEPLFSGYIWYARDVGPVIVAEEDYTRELVGFEAGEGPSPPVIEQHGLVVPPVLGSTGTSLQIALFALGSLALVVAVIILVPRIRRRVTVATFATPEMEADSRHRWLATREASRELLEKAAEDLQRQVQAKPDYADLRAKLGDVLLEMDRTDDAVAQLRQAVEINPDYVQARILLAQGLLRQGEADGALDALQPAAEAHPEYADVRNLMGEIFRALGDLDSARQEFDASLAVNPSFERAVRNLAALDEA